MKTTFFCSTRSPIPHPAKKSPKHPLGPLSLEGYTNSGLGLGLSITHDNTDDDGGNHDDDDGQDDAKVFWDSLLLRPLHTATVPPFCSEAVPPFCSEAVPPFCSGLALAEASADLRRRLTLARPMKAPQRGVLVFHGGVGQRGALKEGVSSSQTESTLEELRHQEEIGSCALQLALLEQTHTITTLQQALLKHLHAMQCTDGDDGDDGDGDDNEDRDGDDGDDVVLRVADAIVNQLTHTGSCLAPPSFTRLSYATLPHTPLNHPLTPSLI